MSASQEQVCPIPANELQRLAALRAFEILDTAPELDFDALTRVAAHAFGTPMAVVALMDSERLWFKSKLGLDVPELDRNVAFCAHTVMRPRETLVVPDLRDDARFAANPLVAQAPHLRFYAGAPIVDAAGHALGTIAVLDAEPRGFSGAQREALVDLSTMVMTALSSRRRALDLERLALTDHLTGIANRAQFDQALAAELRHAMRSGEVFTVLCMDLDGFKDVNDGFGHAAGDETLCEVARRINQQVRLGDVLARLGGDEFAVVMRHGGQDDAAVLARRIVQAVQAPITLSTGDTVGVGISIGMASYTDSVPSVSSLLARADQALYQAKRHNERRWNLFVGAPMR
jgi:diguanylate cyclase (GGDEF)-like protein